MKRQLNAAAGLVLAAGLAACATPRAPEAPTINAGTPINERTTPATVAGAPLNGTAAPAGATAAAPIQVAPSASVRAPAAPVASAPGPAGDLALPSGYPLMAGDAELWPTLTRAQQERALLFLQDGSSIRSSLRTD